MGPKAGNITTASGGQSSNNNQKGAKKTNEPKSSMGMFGALVDNK